MNDDEYSIEPLRNFGSGAKGHKRFCQKMTAQVKQRRSTNARVPTVSFKDSEAPSIPNSKGKYTNLTE